MACDRSADYESDPPKGQRRPANLSPGRLLHQETLEPRAVGQQICQSVFGEENFDPGSAAYVSVEASKARTGETRWFKNFDDLKAHVDQELVCTVVNVERMMRNIQSHGNQLIDERLP